MSKFLNISLALLLMLSNLNLQVVTHYCMGRAMESRLVIGHDHPGCGMEGMDGQGVNIQSDPAYSMEDTGCCTNRYQTLGSQDDYQPVQAQVLDPSVWDYATTPSVVICSQPDGEWPMPESVRMNPPPILHGHDYQVMYQVFLI